MQALCSPQENVLSWHLEPWRGIDPPLVSEIKMIVEQGALHLLMQQRLAAEGPRPFCPHLQPLDRCRRLRIVHTPLPQLPLVELVVEERVGHLGMELGLCEPGRLELLLDLALGIPHEPRDGELGSKLLCLRGLCRGHPHHRLGGSVGNSVQGALPLVWEELKVWQPPKALHSFEGLLPPLDRQDVRFRVYGPHQGPQPGVLKSHDLFAAIPATAE
mmetsp:Transcript_46754/g.113885  ORF Transcript_46754/g.113885 Transcript_46754/m.113885 type:complete len:216 (-) Transcript_46754:151-798(-)